MASKGTESVSTAPAGPRVKKTGEPTSSPHTSVGVPSPSASALILARDFPPFFLRRRCVGGASDQCADEETRDGERRCC